MYYYLKNGEVVAFDDNVIIITKENINIDEEICLDENGYKLFKAIGSDKLKVKDGLLIIDNKTKIALYNLKAPTISNDFNDFCEVDLKYINNASKFVSKSNSRPILKGVYLNSLGTILGSDSYKIYAYDNGFSEEHIVLSQELLKELSRYDGVKKIKTNFSQVCVEIDNKTNIIGRLYAGKYFDISRLLVVKDKTINTDIETFKNIAKLGSMIEGEGKLAKFINNQIKVFCPSYQDSMYVEDFELNKSVTISFDAFKAVASCFDDDVDIYVDDDSKPMYFSKEKVKIVVVPQKEL